MGELSTPQPERYRQSSINEQKLLLWVAIGTIVMLFGAFTSAYVVRRSAGNWYEFKLPDIFFASTLVILASSVSLHWAYSSFKRGMEQRYKIGLIITMVLGLVFVVMQYLGWIALDQSGATFTINPSSSFVYVISGVHAAHVLGGIGALVMATLHAFTLPFRPTKRRRNRFELVVQYWHFVDALWVYLYIFFLFQS